MVPGCAGAPPTVVATVCAIEVPQVEVAMTDIVPAVLPGVAVIELVVEVPVQPEGSVQV